MTTERSAAALSGRVLAARIGLASLLAFAYVLVTGLLDGGSGLSPTLMFAQPRYLLGNALPGLLLAGLLLVLSRRLLLSFGLTFLLQLLLNGINSLKLGNLGTTLVPADFHMVGQLRNGGVHLLSGYLPHSPWPYLAMLVGVLAIVGLFHYEPPLLPQRTHGKRIAAAGALFLGLGSLLAGVPVWAHVYDKHHFWVEPWSAASTAAHSGLVNSLMLFHLQYAKAKQNPDPAAAMQLLSEADQAVRQHMQTPANGDGEAPDIVMIQSESFFDPSILRGTPVDFTPNLHRLAEEGTSGALHVPTYGGGTIRTEFEALSGLSLRYFNDMQFPYLQMNVKVVPGLVRTLRAHGYSTLAVHGNDPTFWNRNNAFKALGFDRFVSRASFPRNAPMDGKYMADRAMTDEIMAQLKNAGPPQFVFAISIEAHGPYDESPGVDAAARDAIPVPAGVTGQAKLELQNYLYHMRHADAELGRLADLLAKRERPTLLMFYGDHLPGLTDTYKAAGFVNGKDMMSQSGVWLMVNPRNPGQAQRQDLAAWMLPGKLLDGAGIHDDAYFALTQVLAPQLAALTHAPGAPPPAEDHNEQQTDRGMANVAMLRFRGKLDPLLSKADAALAEPMIANGQNHPEAAAANGVHQ